MKDDICVNRYQKQKLKLIQMYQSSLTYDDDTFNAFIFANTTMMTMHEIFWRLKCIVFKFMLRIEKL